MFGYTCRDFRIGVVVVLDLGALTKCYQGGVEWGDDAQQPEDKVWTFWFWFQTVVTLDSTNSRTEPSSSRSWAVCVGHPQWLCLRWIPSKGSGRGAVISECLNRYQVLCLMVGV